MAVYVNTEMLLNPSLPLLGISQDINKDAFFKIAFNGKKPGNNPKVY